MSSGPGAPVPVVPVPVVPVPVVPFPVAAVPVVAIPVVLVPMVPVGAVPPPPVGTAHVLFDLVQWIGGPWLMLGQGGRMTVLQVTEPSFPVIGMTTGPRLMPGVGVNTQPGGAPSVTLILAIGM